MKCLRLIAFLITVVATPLVADAPEATITSPAGPITVATDQTISFAATSSDSVGRDGYAVNSFSWSFGDGTNGSGSNATHSYAAPGTYNVALTVSIRWMACWTTDRDGNCVEYRPRTLALTSYRMVTVQAPPKITAFSASPTTVRAGQPVTLSWTTASATALSISGVGTVSGTSTVVYPTATTTYSLTASNAASSASASVTVTAYTVSVGISPSFVSLLLGESATFTATVTPANQGVSWSATGGSLNGGTYIGTASGSNSVTVRSLEDPTKTATATISVTSVSVITPSPANASIPAGSTLQFSTRVDGAVNTDVNWSVSSGANISTTGIFSAVVPGLYTVTATSRADGTKAASTNVTVNDLDAALNGATTVLNGGSATLIPSFAAGRGVLNPGNRAVTSGVAVLVGPLTSTTIYTLTVTNGGYDTSAQAKVTVSPVTISGISPACPTVLVGGSQQFDVTVRGATRPEVHWSVTGGGAIDANTGLFLATTAGSFVITAASVADGGVTTSTGVNVIAVVSGMTISADGSLSLKPGESRKFSAVVSGIGIVDTGVTWQVLESNGGTISSAGIYTAPSVPGDYHIQAKSNQDGTFTKIVAVHVKGWVAKWKRDILYVGAKEIAEVDAQGMHATLIDHLGSPRFVANDQGQPVFEQKFLPFGESLADPMTTTKVGKGFTNHEQTDPSGLIYMQARFYAPWYGRFLSPDPARDQHFEETQSWNIYSYVQNNPTMKIDPTGEAAVPPGEGQRRYQALVNGGYSSSQAWAQIRQETKRDAVAGAVSVGVATGIQSAPALAGAGRAAMGWLATKGGELLEKGRELFSKGSQAASAVQQEAQAASSSPQLQVQFGRVPNQIAHTFRHVVNELGLKASDVEKAVRGHLPGVANQLQPGKPLNQVIEVGGQKLQYTAYLLKDGAINIGRIHGVK